MRVRKSSRKNSGKDMDAMTNTLRGDAEKLDAAAEQLELQVQSSVASIMDATLDENPTVLTQMKTLTTDSDIKDVIKVVNAMREHIYLLEQRLREVDGVNVTEMRLSNVGAVSPRK